VIAGGGYAAVLVGAGEADLEAGAELLDVRPMAVDPKRSVAYRALVHALASIQVCGERRAARRPKESGMASKRQRERGSKRTGA